LSRTRAVLDLGLDQPETNLKCCFFVR